MANNIFSYFSIQLSIFKLSKAVKANTWKKASAGQHKQDQGSDRERETAAVRARQIDINMACRVMDPLKCTTIAVKSKNASAFVFIVP